MEQVPSNRGIRATCTASSRRGTRRPWISKTLAPSPFCPRPPCPAMTSRTPFRTTTGYITEGQFYLRNGRIEPFGSLSRLKQLVNGGTRKDHRALMTA